MAGWSRLLYDVPSWKHPSRLACDMDGMAAAHAAGASGDAEYDWMLLVHV